MHDALRIPHVSMAILQTSSPSENIFSNEKGKGWRCRNDQTPSGRPKTHPTTPSHSFVFRRLFTFSNESVSCQTFNSFPNCKKRGANDERFCLNQESKIARLLVKNLTNKGERQHCDEVSALFLIFDVVIATAF